MARRILLNLKNEFFVQIFEHVTKQEQCFETRNYRTSALCALTIFHMLSAAGLQTC